MNYQVTKMDRRHTGYPRFAYYVSPHKVYEDERRRLLVEWRNWCWATWGFSSERDWASTNVWAWDTEFHHQRIYLQGDKQLSSFHCRWGLAQLDQT